MVDLAKIRRKAREQKEKASEPASRIAIDMEGPAARLERYKTRVLEASAGAAEAPDTEAEAVRTEILTFTLGSETFGIDIGHVEEIVEPREITMVPNAPAPVSGIVSVRGTIVAVLDVRQRLGASSAPADADPRLVIVRDRGGMAGFAVDRVSRVLAIDPAELESQPTLSSAEANHSIRGMIRRGEGVIALIDTDSLLS
jgi:purine-binding chemotaxis protein CheW